jgi:hypothetical protein
MTNDELRRQLNAAALELHQVSTSADGTSMFSPSAPVEERIYSLELAVSDLARDLAAAISLLAQLTAKLSEMQK